MSDTCPIGKIFKLNSAIFIPFGTIKSNLNRLFLPKNIIKCKYHVSHTKPELADFQRDYFLGGCNNDMHKYDRRHADFMQITCECCWEFSS